MGVGELNKIVVFKSNTPTTQGAGAKDGYSTLLTTRGRLRKLSGARNLTFGELVESSSYELKVRYEQTLADNIKRNMKVEIDGKIYTIDSVEQVEEKRKYFLIALKRKDR